MTALCFLLSVFTAIIHVENYQFSIQTETRNIFSEYHNSTFTQKYLIENDLVKIFVHHINYFEINLNFRVFLNQQRLQEFPPDMQMLLKTLFADSQTFKSYFINLSAFLSKKVTYSESAQNHDPLSVLRNKTANCLGLSSTAEFLLDIVNIKSSPVRGFYLKKISKNKFEPIPHRWIEIHLPNKQSFFYDPQYQQFSPFYLLVKDDTDFKKIKKFLVNLDKKTKSILN
jgi:hypothetical protein